MVEDLLFALIPSDVFCLHSRFHTRLQTHNFLKFAYDFTKKKIFPYRNKQKIKYFPHLSQKQIIPTSWCKINAYKQTFTIFAWCFIFAKYAVVEGGNKALNVVLQRCQQKENTDLTDSLPWIPSRLASSVGEGMPHVDKEYPYKLNDPSWDGSCVSVFPAPCWELRWVFWQPELTEPSPHDTTRTLKGGRRRFTEVPLSPGVLAASRAHRGESEEGSTRRAHTQLAARHLCSPKESCKG